MIDSTIDTFEKNLYQTTYQQLSAKTFARLDALLESQSDEESNEDKEVNDILTFVNYLETVKIQGQN